MRAAPAAHDAEPVTQADLDTFERALVTLVVRAMANVAGRRGSLVAGDAPKAANRARTLRGRPSARCPGRNEARCQART